MAEIDAHTGFPVPKSDTAKELTPYLQAILMGQAAILERLKFNPREGEEPMDKNDILDWFADIVNAKAAQKPVARATVRNLRKGGTPSTSITQ